MSFFRSSDDPIFHRIRSVMLVTMLLSAILPLAGQPASYWHLPATALRMDGSAIRGDVHTAVEFLLAAGWKSYLAAGVLYVAAVFAVVSLLPRRVRLIAALSFMLGHYFGGSNWLAVRWHMGTEGPVLCGVVLSVAFALGMSPAPDQGRLVRTLRWVIVAAMALDSTLTLIGQPASFWHDPATMHEANSMIRIFLGRGWAGYLLLEAAYCAGIFWLASVLPRTVGLAVLFGCLLFGFIGSSCWFFFEWETGIVVPAIYGAALSAWIVLMSLSPARGEVDVKSSRGRMRARPGRWMEWGKDSISVRCGAMKLPCRRSGA